MTLKRPHCSSVWLPFLLPIDLPSLPKRTNREISLETSPSTVYASGLFFGAVKTGKRSVSFHLMPVYVDPDLVQGISPELRKRIQGKSCFNFTRQDDALLGELETLTAAGFARIQDDGTIPVK
jgi:hypothetical protein